MHLSVLKKKQTQNHCKLVHHLRRSFLMKPRIIKNKRKGKGMKGKGERKGNERKGKGERKEEKERKGGKERKEKERGKGPTEKDRGGTNHSYYIPQVTH